MKLTPEQINNIIERMDKDGVFTDTMGDQIIAQWNRKNRLAKTRNWLERGIITSDCAPYVQNEIYVLIP
jgi:hypothetical protein